MIKHHELREILDLAFKQVSEGKGRERHSSGGTLDFNDQPILKITELLQDVNGLAFQVIKKVKEARDLPTYEAQERELLGAIVYAAAMIIHYRRVNGVKPKQIKLSDLNPGSPRWADMIMGHARETPILAPKVINIVDGGKSPFSAEMEKAILNQLAQSCIFKKPDAPDADTTSAQYESLAKANPPEGDPAKLEAQRRATHQDPDILSVLDDLAEKGYAFHGGGTVGSQYEPFAVREYMIPCVTSALEALHQAQHQIKPKSTGEATPEAKDAVNMAGATPLRVVIVNLTQKE